ncbi:hypothetical protein [Coleofasciculus sp. G2-EDA-02]|uniref:hypothetical protein n=1 Tax=Coleofasciculus sp. G2-EDA-02 TaxID=3069529 RepID=UPI0032FCDE8C
MQVPVRLLPGAIADLFAQVSMCGKITMADRYGLMAALLEDDLTEEERNSIDRLLHAFCRGRMHIVDKISMIL